MDKFVEEAEKHGIDRQAILDMVKRDIAEKKRISDLIKWIKIRQIISIVLSVIVILWLLFIFKQSRENGEVIYSLLHTLVEGFKQME